MAPADRLTLPSLCQGYPLPFVPWDGPHRLTPRSPHPPFQQLRLSTTSFILSWQSGIESCWEKTDLKLESSLIPVLFLTSDWWIKMILWITVSVLFQSQGWTVITLPVRYTLAKSGFLKQRTWDGWLPFPDAVWVLCSARALLGDWEFSKVLLLAHAVLLSLKFSLSLPIKVLFVIRSSKDLFLLWRLPDQP